MSIYIMTHKNFEPFTNSTDYKTMLVGADFNKADKTYIKDNSFIGNISNKNGSFCELTGAYWMWKQANEEILGLVHYRRYFVNSNGDPVSLEEVENMLSNFDIILPEKVTTTFLGLPCSMKKHFKNGHGKEGQEAWETCKEVILKNNPEFADSFEEVENSSEGYFYNMCIMRKDMFDSYHKWLFDTLFEVEKKIDVTKYSKYNQRMFGFLSERLMTIWVTYHKLNVKELPINFSEPISYFKNLKLFLDRKFSR